MMITFILMKGKLEVLSEVVVLSEVIIVVLSEVIIVVLSEVVM